MELVCVGCVGRSCDDRLRVDDGYYVRVGPQLGRKSDGQTLEGTLRLLTWERPMRFGLPLSPHIVLARKGLLDEEEWHFLVTLKIRLLTFIIGGPVGAAAAFGRSR